MIMKLTHNSSPCDEHQTYTQQLTLRWTPNLHTTAHFVMNVKFTHNSSLCDEHQTYTQQLTSWWTSNLHTTAHFAINVRVPQRENRVPQRKNREQSSLEGEQRTQFSREYSSPEGEQNSSPEREQRTEERQPTRRGWGAHAQDDKTQATHHHCSITWPRLPTSCL